MMKNTTAIDIRHIRFDYDTDDPVICLLENQPTLEDRLHLLLMNEESIPFDEPTKTLDPTVETETIDYPPYNEQATQQEIIRYPDFSLAYARWQAQQKIADIDDLMDVFDTPIIASDVKKYWLDGYDIIQIAMRNQH